MLASHTCNKGFKMSPMFKMSPILTCVTTVANTARAATARATQPMVAAPLLAPQNHLRKQHAGSPCLASQQPHTERAGATAPAINPCVQAWCACGRGRHTRVCMLPANQYVASPCKPRAWNLESYVKLYFPKVSSTLLPYRAGHYLLQICCYACVLITNYSGSFLAASQTGFYA